MRIRADREACVGAGQCVLTDLSVFDQGEDGIVVLLADRVGEEDGAAVRRAARLCPGRALSVLPG